MFGINLDPGAMAMGYMNYQQQKGNLEYQKRLQKQIFRREDTAVQRRAKDMAAAGLSKTLAAGGGAQSGAVVSTKAPEISGFETGGVLSNMRLMQDISKTEVERKRIEMDTEKKTYEIFNLGIRAGLMGAQAGKESWNLELAKKYGVPTTVSGEAAQWIYMAQVIRKIAPDVYNKLKGIFPNLEIIENSEKYRTNPGTYLPQK